MDEKERKVITRHFELEVYQRAARVAMQIFELSKGFPPEERYSLTDQIRRSSRSVCANLAEAWRKRRYAAHWVSKLTDSDAEAAETQTWLQFAVECGYLPRAEGTNLFKEYDTIIGMLVTMINHSEKWQIK